MPSKYDTDFKVAVRFIQTVCSECRRLYFEAYRATLQTQPLHPKGSRYKGLGQLFLCEGKVAVVHIRNADLSSVQQFRVPSAAIRGDVVKSGKEYFEEHNLLVVKMDGDVIDQYALLPMGSPLFPDGKRLVDLFQRQQSHKSPRGGLWLASSGLGLALARNLRPATGERSPVGLLGTRTLARDIHNMLFKEAS